MKLQPSVVLIAEVLGEELREADGVLSYGPSVTSPPGLESPPGRGRPHNRDHASVEATDRWWSEAGLHLSQPGAGKEAPDAWGGGLLLPPISRHRRRSRADGLGQLRQRAHKEPSRPG